MPISELEELVERARKKFGPNAPVTKDYEVALMNSKRRETSARDLYIAGARSPQELVEEQKDSS
jgi:hypothetical protein